MADQPRDPDGKWSATGSGTGSGDHPAKKEESIDASSKAAATVASHNAANRSKEAEEGRPNQPAWEKVYRHGNAAMAHDRAAAMNEAVGRTEQAADHLVSAQHHREVVDAAHNLSVTQASEGSWESKSTNW